MQNLDRAGLYHTHKAREVLGMTFISAVVKGILA